MLTLNIVRLCNERMIPNPKKFLSGLGFYPNVVTNLIKGARVRLDYGQIERLCLALHCTPNDLFAWQPDAGVAVDAAQPIHGLIRKPAPALTDMIINLPPEKMAELHALAVKLAAPGE